MKEKRVTIIIRIEISTLLNRDSKINRHKMDRLAMVLTNLHNSGKHVLIVSSGAIVLGSDKLNLSRLPDDPLDMQATAAVGQAELIRYYQQFFNDYNQVVAQVLLTSDIISYAQRVENTRNTFRTLLDMNIIPIINENDAVSTADIDIDDNYPLALIVAEIARGDFIVLKMEIEGKYMIIPKGSNRGLIVNNEMELQEKIDSLCEVMLEKIPEEAGFPASIGEIVF